MTRSWQHCYSRSNAAAGEHAVTMAGAAAVAGVAAACFSGSRVQPVLKPIKPSV